jgi:hypothetical protein
VTLGAATTQADELLVAAVDRGFMGTTGFAAGTNGTANPCATTGTTTYSALPAVQQVGTIVYPLYCIVAATGTYQANATFDANNPWSAVLATYRAAPPTPTATPTPTPTATATPTPAPTATPTGTPGATSTPSPTSVPMPSATPNPTATPAAATATPTLPPSTPAFSRGGPPPTATPTPPPDCGQSGQRDDAAPAGYASDPRGPQGQSHAEFGQGLTTLLEREAFRQRLPAGADLAAINDTIARGCSARWLGAHVDTLGSEPLP